MDRKKPQPGRIERLPGVDWSPQPLPEHASADEYAERLNDFLSLLCDAAMPKRTVLKGTKSVHWWSDGIADLRKRAIAARWVYQRAGRRSGPVVRATELEAYNAARFELNLAIRSAQERN